MPNNVHHLTIEDNGHVLAIATLRTLTDDHSVHADLHIEAGHLPVGTRTRLVDAVLDQAATETDAHLEVTLPAGDGEILDRLRQRCQGLEARAAGSSCIARGVIPHSRPTQTNFVGGIS